MDTKTLNLETTGNNADHETNGVIALMEDLIGVSVQFFGSTKFYAYLTNREDLEVGDSVVVNSPSSGMTIAKVVDVGIDFELQPRGYTYKFIVDKVNTGAYDELNDKVEQAKALMRTERKKAQRAQIRHSLALGKEAETELAKLVKTRL